LSTTSAVKGAGPTRPDCQTIYAVHRCSVRSTSEKPSFYVHSINILNDGFCKVGIGVLDGGIYGKMFVQEFSD
jgi:hypothetical protein